MRSLLTVVLAVALTVVTAQAAMELVEDFDSYAVGTVHVTPDGTNLPIWQVQRNSSALGDPGWVTAEDPLADGNMILKVTNRDLDGEVDTIYASMYLGATHPITAEGTIYVRFSADGGNDTLLATNDKFPGWDYLTPDTAGAPNYQMTADNYTEMGVIVRLSGGEDFRARDGGSTGAYRNVSLGQPINAWQELWIQIDHANDREKFYWCLDGGTPTVVMNPAGGEWWSMRNQTRDNDSVQVIKFFIGSMNDGGEPPVPLERNVMIESIGVDTAAMTDTRYDGWELGPDIWIQPCAGADFDGDGDVDLDDFVILKTNFGTGTTQPEGDADCDGDVDLDDFVILKSTFGS